MIDKKTLLDQDQKVNSKGRIRMDDPELIKRYGSWVRVQIAFYDFIFIEGEFFDHEDIRDKEIIKFQLRFKTPEDAWMEFRRQSLCSR